MKYNMEYICIYRIEFYSRERERQFSTANSVNSRGCVTLSRERRPTPDMKRESIRFANSSRTFATTERTREEKVTE